MNWSKRVGYKIGCKRPVKAENEMLFYAYFFVVSNFRNVVLCLFFVSNFFRIIIFRYLQILIIAVRFFILVVFCFNFVVD